MISIEFSKPFKKEFKKLISGRPDLGVITSQKLLLFAANHEHPSLKLHKLKGQLAAYSSFTVEYDLRIIIQFNTDKSKAILISIGKHDNVY